MGQTTPIYNEKLFTSLDLFVLNSLERYAVPTKKVEGVEVPKPRSKW